MKYSWSLLLLLISGIVLGQPLIHAHNDYQQPEPLTHALRYKVFSLEVDVFLYHNRLVVAHDKKELPAAVLLDSLYLKPIIQLFKLHDGRISSDPHYAPVLMIDIKEKAEEVLPELLLLLQPYRFVFDQSVNKQAVQIVISGDRGPIAAWSAYAPLLFFDGRPNEVYDPATLQRVAFISDSYASYRNNADSIRQVVTKIHGLHKLFRLWGSPDTATDWKQLLQWGIDILNTDKVAECRESFN